MPRVKLGWDDTEIEEIRSLAQPLYRCLIEGAAEKEVFELVWEYWVRTYGVPVPPSCPPWEPPTVQERAARSRLLCSLIFYGRTQARIKNAGIPEDVNQRIRQLTRLVKYQETPFGAAMEAWVDEEDESL